MTKLGFFLLLSLNASFTLAETYFDQLGDMFHQGELPLLEEIMLTPWTGRCFDQVSPNHPTNIGLYVREKEALEDAGPISIAQYEISNYTFHQRAANYLDDKDHDYLAALIEPFYEVVNISSEDLSFFNRQSGRAVWAYLRRSGEYLVQGFYDQYGREGKIRCYYWKTF